MFSSIFHNDLLGASAAGVLPGWCTESCEGLGGECGHLATQCYLDAHLVTGLGAYARRQPPPVRLPDGNYSTNGGV